MSGSETGPSLAFRRNDRVSYIVHRHVSSTFGVATLVNHVIDTISDY